MDHPVSEDRAKCPTCHKTYSKLSNLNQHIKNKHSGRVFICPHCQEEQTSKDAHKKHLKRRHGNDSVINVEENEHTIQEERVELTNEAKDALIKRLQAELDENKRIIAKKNSIIHTLKKKIVASSLVDSVELNF